jgi:biotin carboxyl carrier protein
MEHSLHAPVSGVVEAVRIRTGEHVSLRQILLVIEPRRVEQL